MRSLFWIVLLLLACCAAGCQGQQAKTRYISSYHVKLIVNGDLVTEWYSSGPVWRDDDWNCVFIDDATKKLIRIVSKLPAKEDEEAKTEVVVVTSMDKVGEEVIPGLFEYGYRSMLP